MDDKLYLPLAEMMSLLEFNIKVDPQKGTAEGTFIDSEHNFALDVHDSEVTANHKQYPLSKDSIFVKNDQIYVSADDFSKWFDIQSRFDKKMMALALDTSVVLPVESRMKRHNLWDKLMAAQKAKQQNYQTVENPYQLISWPFIDVNLSSSYSSDSSSSSSSSSFTNNFTLLSAGDLGYLTTKIYAGGSSDDQLNNLRIVAGRKDPKAELLGPLQATAFSLGDIDSPALTLVTTNSLSRGISITNRALNTPDNFDTHTFVGNAMPGWEVELYRNNVLLAFQIADNNGRYEFRDIPLVYGTNTFRIALYGPQGQSEDRIETYLVGSTMLKPDQFEYTFSVNQEGESLINLDSQSTTGESTVPRGWRGIAEARYGVAQFLTLGAGAAQAELNDGTHRYMTGSANTSFFGVLTEGNFVKDIASGWATGLTAITSIYDVSVRARHRIFNNFTSEIENNPSDPRKSETTLDMNGQYYLPLIEDLNFGVRAKRETFTYQVPRLTYSSSYSKAIWGISFSNTLDLIRDTKQRIQGNLGVQTRLWNILFRFDGRYDVEPIMGPNGAMLTTQYRLTDELSGQTQLFRELGDADGTSIRQTINWDLQDYRLSFSGEMNDKYNATFGVNLVFSVAHDEMFNRWHTQSQSMSGSGAIANKVFVDDNYNNTPEENEKVFTDAILRMNRVPIRPRDDTTFIAPVGAYEPVNVDVDASTFKDPMLSSSIEGFRVTTRPGDVINLQFPVVSTSEIDGNVKLIDRDGKRHDIPDIVIELQDKNGKLIKRVMSESDGYFVLTRVLPGEYILTIPSEALEEYKAELVNPVNVKVEKTSEFYTGNDITLRTNTPVEPKKRKGKK